MVDELLTWRFGSRSVEFIEPIGAAGRPNTLTGWYTQMEMLIGGTWQPAASGRTEDVTSPFGGTVTGTVPVADAADVRPALDRAGDGVVTWRRTPAMRWVVGGVGEGGRWVGDERGGRKKIIEVREKKIKKKKNKKYKI